MPMQTSLGSSGVAPTAPGALGVPVHAADAQTYLNALREWVAQRRADLDAVDEAVLKLPMSEQVAITTDLTVALTFWKAISDRLVLLETTFDGGRVGPKEAERLSTLIHGRLDPTTTGELSLATSGSLAVSLPEACRLLDSLTRTLQARASLAPGAAESSQRIVLARAAVERIRDQVPLVPAGTQRDAATEELARTDKRLVELVERARRGADVGGSIGPLEIDIATLERDLIVAAAERAQAARTRAQTQQRVSELEARAEAIRGLEAQALAAADPAPHLAVPNVAALGPVPQAKPELTAYRDRLDRVSRALDLAHERYAAALAELDELGGLAGAVGAMAQTLRPDPAAAQDLADLRRRLDQVLAAKPVRVVRARALLAAYQSYVEALSRPNPSAQSTAPARKARP
jgi:HAMP domain-containing protein